jgi:RNA polymerase sigma-70 factor, ECF subfamily
MRHERFERLIEPIHNSALAFARSISRSRADGDDLFQEAIVRALDRVDQLRDDAAFRYWLYRVIVSVHRNRCRKEFWRRLIPLGGDERAPDRPVDDSLGANGRARLALASLPAAQREAIVLFEIEGWQVEEIADLSGTSISAIKSRLARGRARLRTFYTKQLDVVAEVALIPGDSP